MNNFATSKEKKMLLRALRQRERKMCQVIKISFFTLLSLVYGALVFVAGCYYGDSLHEQAIHYIF